MSNYHTSDTAEASYLIAHGAKLVSIQEHENDDKRTIILSEENEGQIADLLLIWGNGKCPEKSFFLKYKWLLKQVAPKNNNS